MAPRSPSLSQAPQHRFDQLDGLRGVAALTVVVLHLTIVFALNRSQLYTSIDHSLWRVVYAGHEAVILFFILSGFVLALPFLNSRRGSYVQFAIRRICRIWLPYLVAITIAAVCWFFIYGHPHGSDISLRTLLHHYLLLGEFNYNAFDGPVWSLVLEMRISLLFPLLMLLVTRLKWYIIIPFALLLSVSGSWLHLRLMPADTLLTNYFDTLHYAAFFLLGALLARERAWAAPIIGRLEPWMGLLIPLLAIAIYINAYITYPVAWAPFKPGDWGTAVGALIFLAYALGSRYAARVLTIGPIAFLGRISYSLYLYHLIVIFSLAAWLQGHGGPWLGSVVSLLVAIPIAYLAWRWVEQPTMRLGRILARQVASWPSLGPLQWSSRRRASESAEAEGASTALRRLPS